MTNELKTNRERLSLEEGLERFRRWRLVLGKMAENLEQGGAKSDEESEAETTEDAEGSGEDAGEGSGEGLGEDASEGAEGSKAPQKYVEGWGKQPTWQSPPSAGRGKQPPLQLAPSAGSGLLDAEDLQIDKTLESLYGDGDSNCGGDLSPSSPNVSLWLGDVRKYFPQRVVEVLEHDALERVGLKGFLNEPEVLKTLEPDVNLVAKLLSFSSIIPEETKATARFLVRKLVDDVVKRLNSRTVAAVSGAISRSLRTNRPRQGEIDFYRTIMRNLKNWNDSVKKLIVDRLFGYGRKRRSLFDVVLCVDQSGSMASSVVYSSILASVLASIPAVSTKLVFFDTSVVDMTSKVHDPVDVLFGAQLGGGTDIAQALGYCRSIITRPNKTFFALVSDLYEGNDVELMLDNMRRITASGVKTACLLALNDAGRPFYHRQNAAWCAGLGAATFACTPDAFPELIAAVINGRDLNSWAASQGFTPVAPAPRASDGTREKQAS